MIRLTESTNIKSKSGSLLLIPQNGQNLGLHISMPSVLASGDHPMVDAIAGEVDSAENSGEAVIEDISDRRIHMVGSWHNRNA